jgi:hypothetical protein
MRRDEISRRDLAPLDIPRRFGRRILDTMIDA